MTSYNNKFHMVMYPRQTTPDSLTVGTSDRSYTSRILHYYFRDVVTKFKLNISQVNVEKHRSRSQLWWH